MFGLERLSGLLREAANDHPAAAVRRVVDAVSVHASGFRATDDVTVLAVRWNPSGVTASTNGSAMGWHMELDVSIEGVRHAQERLRAILAARDIVPERLADAELVAEEILSNIVRTAGAPAGEARVSLDITVLPSEIVLTFRDNGAEFDPLSRPSPPIDVDIADRAIGGLGLVLVKQLAARCAYSRVDGWNVLEVRLTRQP
jgi:anti-sigma regulatory factor (Ser/Thr protein kinase)